jgi:hypothetical protein
MLKDAIGVWFATVRTGALEAGLFGPCGAALRPLARRAIESDLRAAAPDFADEFYVRQFPDDRRSRIRRAPLLHYLLIGWREGKTPRPDFDPGFYRATHVNLKRQADPFLHFVRSGRERPLPGNEAAAVPGLPWRAGRPAVLTIHHARGGGSSQYLDLFEQDLWQQGTNILRLRAVRWSPSLGVVEDHAERPRPAAPSRVFDLADERCQLADFARARGVTRLLVNHLVDRPLAAMDWIEDLARKLDCPYDVVLHDYYVLCPRIDLVDGQGRFCGIASPESCVQCVTGSGSQARELEPLTWRDSFAGFLARAETVFVPSEDAARRLAPFVRRAVTVRPPEGDDALPPEQWPTLQASEPLRVAVLGGLSVAKGLGVVASLAGAARRTSAPLTLSVLGPVAEPALLARKNVRIAGAYRSDEVDRLVEEEAPHVIFLPAVWPETWSFVLSVALRRGIPVVAFDIGAPAERLRRLSRGKLLDLDLAERPFDLLREFLALRRELVAA